MRKRDADRLRSNLRRSIEQLTVLEAKLPELLRRGEVSARPDGWPASSPGFAEGGKGADEMTSVEAAVIGRARPDGDVVGRLLRDLMRNLEDISRSTNAAAGLADLVSRGEPQRGRQLSVPECVNPHCDDLALPRPRAGRCEACYRYRQSHAGADRPRELAERSQTA